MPGILPETSSTAPRFSHALGFYSGVRALFGGLAFVVTTPSVWGYALIPVAIATALLIGFGTGAIWGANELAQIVLGDATGTLTTLGIWMLRIVFAATGLILAFVIAISLAQPLSGFALEAISKKQAAALGDQTDVDQPVTQGLVRSLKVTLTALALGLPVLFVLAVITVVFPPASVVTIPLKFIVTGVLAAYDLLDYPLSLRGVSVRARLGFMRANFPAVLGFGVATAAVLLIPGVGLLLLPIGAAGAARMVTMATRAGGGRALS